MLTNLILQGFKINPDTPIEKILKFRRRHADELGRFRTCVGELVAKIEAHKSLESVQQQADDIVRNEVKPAIGELKDALRDCDIAATTGGLLKCAFFTSAPASLLVVAGLTVPHAIVAGAGISLMATAVECTIKGSELLRKSPFSYMLSIEKGLK